LVSARECVVVKMEAARKRGRLRRLELQRARGGWLAVR
jgi:hypothetical protein